MTLEWPLSHCDNAIQRWRAIAVVCVVPSYAHPDTHRYARQRGSMTRPPSSQ
jgi:hypothetical protein